MCNSHYVTVSKYHDFSTTQHLSVIAFGHSKSAKTSILTNLEALNFDLLKFFTF